MRNLVVAFALLLAAMHLYEHPVPPPRPEKPVVKPTPHTDAQCVASAIYHEARGEPLEGQRAVYEVIKNRARALRKSLCAVVKSPSQFSWYGHKPILPFGKQMQELLRKVKNQPSVLEGEKFKWFFGSHIEPKWSVDMECREIGGHKFCKEKEDDEDSGQQVRLRSDHPGVPEG